MRPRRELWGALNGELNALPRDHCWFLPLTATGFGAGAELFALFDTGAAFSVMANTDVKLLGLCRDVKALLKPVRLRTATGDIVHITKQVFVTLEAIGVVSFLVPDVPVTTLLGMDFLTTSRPRVDWEHRRLVFDKVSWDRSLPVRVLPAPTGAQTLQTLQPPEDGPLNPEPDMSGVPDWLVSAVQAAGLWQRPVFPPSRSQDVAIRLVDGADTPFARGRRYSATEQQTISAEVQRLLDIGLIQPSQSPFAAAVHFVGKKSTDGSNAAKRMVVDYRALNEITVPDRYPLPRIESMLHAVQGATVISTLDLRSGFHQLRMKPEAQQATAFATPAGLFEWRVLPFGLKNAPAAFQRFMDYCLRAEIQAGFALVYIDDVIVFSDSPATHKLHLAAVVRALSNAGLRLNFEKCAFGKPAVEFCGHTVSGKTIRPLNDKIAVIRDWPEPTTARELRSFLGFTQFYAKFVVRHAAAVAHLTPLLKKDAPFQWAESHREAFVKLKDGFAADLKLVQPDESRPFVLHTDSSAFAIGACLSQQDTEGVLRPVEFFSRKMSGAETRYPVHEQEMLALVRALLCWRHFLIGSQFTVFTDNRALTFMKTAGPEQLSARQARWLEHLLQFDFCVKHIAGTANTAADAISRLPLPERAQDKGDLGEQSEHAQLAALWQHPSQDWMAAYAKEPQLWPQYLRPDGTPHVGTYVRDGRIMDNGRVLVPTEHLQSTVRAVHEAGHWGTSKTITLVRRYFAHPNLAAAVAAVTKACDTCMRVKAGHGPQLPIKRMPRPSTKWSDVHVDWVCGLPRNPAGHNQILVVLDAATGLSHLIPASDRDTALDFARQFVDGIVRFHGLPSVVRTDRDYRARAAWAAVCDRLQITHHMSTAWHPRANGRAERTVRMVNDQLKMWARETGDWEAKLTACELALNSRPLEASHLTPFFLTYGFHPVTPMDVTALTPQRVGPLEPPKDFGARLHRDMDAFANRINKAGLPDVLEPPSSPYTAGDWVLVAAGARPALLSKVDQDRPPKLRPKWVGPFLVEHIGSGNTAKLVLPTDSRIHPVIHFNYLKKYESLPPPEPTHLDRAHAVPGPASPVVDLAVPPVPPAVGVSGAPEAGAREPPTPSGNIVAPQEDDDPPVPPSRAVRADAPAPPVAVKAARRPAASAWEQERCLGRLKDGRGHKYIVKWKGFHKPSDLTLEARADVSVPVMDHPVLSRSSDNDPVYVKDLTKLLGIARGVKRPADDAETRKRSRLCQLASVGDFELRPRLFRKLCDRWAKPVRDVFASMDHHQCPDYWSWEDDAFLRCWSPKLGLLFVNPPFNLMGRVVAKLRRDGTDAVVVAPERPHTWWWRFLKNTAVDSVWLPLAPYRRGGQTLPDPGWRSAAFRIKTTKNKDSPPAVPNLTIKNL
jgi:hypothetical protein